MSGTPTQVDKMKHTRRLERLEAELAPAIDPPMAEVIIVTSADGCVVERFLTPWSAPEDGYPARFNKLAQR